MKKQKRSRLLTGAVAALAVVAALALAACGQSKADGADAGSAAASSDASASATGKLVVGFDKAYPPYGFEGDDGEYTGFDLGP